MVGGASARADGPVNRVLIPNHDRVPDRPPSDLLWDFAGETMGTTWAVTLVPQPEEARETFQSAIEDELARIIALFSHWDPSSELARFNAAPEGFWAVSQPFWDLLNQAMDMADDTDGAVDPTLGALVDLWGFGPPGPRPLDSFGAAHTVPFASDIDDARARSGWRSLRLNRQQRAVQQPGGMRLDLSGIAKGHAVDVVSDRLNALGATSHLVEIGGELRGRGVKPDGRPWWTELQQAPDSPAPRTLAALFDLAVATSGDWVRGFETYGQRYSHTIDGRTGRPIDNGVASVTVLADTAMYADAMATALTVMGPTEGPAFATAMKIAAAFVVRGDTGPIEIITPAFQAMLDEGA